MALQDLVARSNEVVLSSTTVDLLIALLVLVITGLLATGALFIFRRHRRSTKEAGLPLYNEHLAPKKSNHRRLTFTASSRGLLSKSAFVHNEKQELLARTSSPPPSTLPEIRITFPEEVDDAGKMQSGRVVIVHVGEKGDVGLEPIEENLPAYQRAASERFQSLDMDRIGGLKERA